MTSDPDDPLSDPRIQAQARLNPIMDELEAFIDSNGLRSGFAQIASDALNYRFTLYWRGALPPELQQCIDQLQSSTGVQIDIRSVSYSEAEMESEVRRIASLPPSRTGGAHLTEVGPTCDFSGIFVGVADASEIEPARNAIDSPLPLTIEVGADIMPA